MTDAYFVGRAELLQWINSTLSLNYTKVEQVRSGEQVSILAIATEYSWSLAGPVLRMQTANGAVACQMVDALHPGTIALSKVRFDVLEGHQTAALCDATVVMDASVEQLCINVKARLCSSWSSLSLPGTLAMVRCWQRHAVQASQVKFNASTEYDMINNYKILQIAFIKNNIAKVLAESLVACPKHVLSHSAMSLQKHASFMMWTRDVMLHQVAPCVTMRRPTLLTPEYVVHADDRCAETHQGQTVGQHRVYAMAEELLRDADCA